MAEGIAVADEVLIPFRDRRAWQIALNLIAAILIAAVFLIVGVWKITDPAGAAARLA